MKRWQFFVLVSLAFSGLPIAGLLLYGFIFNPLCNAIYAALGWEFKYAFERPPVALTATAFAVVPGYIALMFYVPEWHEAVDKRAKAAQEVARGLERLR